MVLDDGVAPLPRRSGLGLNADAARPGLVGPAPELVVQLLRVVADLRDEGPDSLVLPGIRQPLASDDDAAVAPPAVRHQDRKKRWTSLSSSTSSVPTRGR